MAGAVFLSFKFAFCVGFASIIRFRASLNSGSLEGSDMAVKKFSEASFDKFMRAVGLYVTTFALVEHSLREYVAKLGNLSREMHAALLSSLRIEGGMDMARRLFRAHHETPPDYIERAFTQLNHINQARNLLLHYPTASQGGPDENGKFRWQTVASNFQYAMPGAGRSIPISTEILAAMTADLETISGLIGLCSRWEDNDHCREWLEHYVQRPWQYTPPSPPQQSRKSQPQPRTRKGPPQSSEA